MLLVRALDRPFLAGPGDADVVSAVLFALGVPSCC